MNMKTSDAVNVLSHLPPDTIVSDFGIKVPEGILSGLDALDNLQNGKPITDGAEPFDESPSPPIDNTPTVVDPPDPETTAA